MFNSITKNASLITGFLIFLGYCKYHFYYSQFDITIYNYLGTTELLLSFLPIIVTYFLPLLLFAYLAVITPENKYRTKDGKDITNRILRHKKVRRPVYLMNRILFTRRVKLKTKARLLLVLALDAGFMWFCILMWATIDFLRNISSNQPLNQMEGIFYFISIGWIFFFLEPFISKAAESSTLLRSLLSYRSIQFVNFFLILTYFLYFSQKINGLKILKGDRVDFVKVKFKNRDSLSTDKNTIFLGQTKDYVFFRRKADSTNIIIPASEVEALYKSKIK